SALNFSGGPLAAAPGGPAVPAVRPRECPAIGVTDLARSGRVVPPEGPSPLLRRRYVSPGRCQQLKRAFYRLELGAQGGDVALARVLLFLLERENQLPVRFHQAGSYLHDVVAVLDPDGTFNVAGTQ